MEITSINRICHGYLAQDKSKQSTHLKHIIKYPMDVLQIQHFSQVFFTTVDMTYYELDLVHGKSVVSGGLK